MTTENVKTESKPFQEEVNGPLISLPQIYPLLPKSRVQLKDLQPQSKTTYNNNYVQPFINKVEETLVEVISIKLEIAAQKFQGGLLEEDAYNKVRDAIYEDISSQDYIEGVRDAFNQYSLSSDAYALFLTSTFSKNTQTLDINNLYDYVLQEKELMKNNPEAHKTLLEDFQSKLDSLSVQHKPTFDKEVATLSNHIQQIIFVATYPQNPLPSKLTKENAVEDDDELEVEGGKVDLTCPISREIYIKPVKNSNCGHSYNYDSLKIYVRSSNKCPDCEARVALDCVVPDKIMEVRVRCYKRDKKLNELIKDRFDDETDKL